MLVLDYMPGRSVALPGLPDDCDEVQDWKTESRLHISLLTKTKKNPGIFTYYKTTKLNTHKEKEKIIIDYFIDIL